MLQSQRILVIGPLSPTQLRCRPFFTPVDGSIRGPRTLGALSSIFLFPCISSVYRQEFHTIKREGRIFCLQVLNIFPFLVQSSLPAHSVASLSQTHPRLCHHHLCFHLVWLYGTLFIPDACVGCHHFVLLHLNSCFKVSTTALGLSSRTHPMARHILSAITSYRKENHLYQFGPGNSAGSRVIVRPCLIFTSFEAKWTIHRLCFPSFNSV